MLPTKLAHIAWLGIYPAGVGDVLVDAGVIGDRSLGRKERDQKLGRRALDAKASGGRRALFNLLEAAALRT